MLRNGFIIVLTRYQLNLKKWDLTVGAWFAGEGVMPGKIFELNRDLVDRLQSCRRTGTLHDREAGKVLGLYMPLRYAPMLLSDSRTADAG